MSGRSAPTRYMYHSFPRPRQNASTSEEITEKGLRILRGMVEVGLVLAPEILKFRPPSPIASSEDDLIRIAQKRMSFTYLEPRELPGHAEQFGQFALELDHDDLRRLGAVPVFYLPQPLVDDMGDPLASSIGWMLISDLGDIQSVLDGLSGQTVVPPGAQTPIRIDHLRGAVQALSGLFYPTEDFEFNDQLGYYRQREWRIISHMVLENVHLARDLTAREKELVSAADQSWWNHIVTFRDGDARRIDQAKTFDRIRGRAVPFEFVRRVIVPDGSEGDAAKIFSRLQAQPTVVSLSEVVDGGD